MDSVDRPDYRTTPEDGMMTTAAERGTVAEQHTLAEFDKSCQACVSFHEGLLLTCCAYWPQVQCRDITVDDILFYVSENGCTAHQKECLTLAGGYNPSPVCSCTATGHRGEMRLSTRSPNQQQNNTSSSRME